MLSPGERVVLSGSPGELSLLTTQIPQANRGGADRSFARSPIVLAAVALLVCSGCGSSVRLGQVDGTVQLDGKPIGQVMVIFVPDDRNLPQSTAITDEHGHFQMRCNNGSMGAAIGEHRVTLVDGSAAPASKGRNDDPPEPTEQPPNRIPSAYNQATKTPLRQTVAAGSQTITLEIASEKKPT
jgi:hypothetical protein